jgi:DinB superfamily
MKPEPRIPTGRPEAGEFADYALADIELVSGDDAIEALQRQAREVVALFGYLGEDRIKGLTYAPGKWTLKEVLGHLMDDERIFAYRALCVARGDGRPLPGFEENDYVTAADFELRSLTSLLDEYRAVRIASLALFESLPESAWQRRGTVNGYSASPRGLAFHIAGHELHHLGVVREKYLPAGFERPKPRVGFIG